ncbi:MAG: Exocyst complex component 8, partial [Marteilia pararefringens]
MNFVKHQLIEHKMILQALFESLVDDDQRKIINFGNDDKQMCKIDLNSIKNFPETMIETLNESVLKFSSPLKFLSPNSFEVLDTYIVSLYSTHFLICCRGKESDDTKHPNLHFKHLIGIDNCKIITVKDGDSTVKNIFQILTSDMTLIFQASSLFLKNQWESIFEELGILKKRRRNVLSTMGSSAELHKCEEKYTFEQYQELIEYPKILKEQIIKCRYLEAAKKIENFYSTYFVQQCDSKYHYIFDSVKSMKLELISKIKKFFTEIDDNHLFQNLTHQRNCFKSLMIIGKSFEAQDLYFSRQSTLLDFRIRKTLLDDSSSNGIIYNIFFTTFSHVNEVYEFFYEMMSINCIEYFIIWATNKIKMMLDISRSYLFRSSIPLKSSTDSLQRAIKLAKTMPSFNIPILFLFDEVLHEEIL